MIKLEKGYWGSNDMTLGVRNYRGFHVVVDSDMGLPVIGEGFRVGIYEVQDDYDGIEVMEFRDYSEEKCTKMIDLMIGDILGFRARRNKAFDMAQSIIKESECTCGAKHTSNSSFHLSWCDKK
jgi:hypothetical protein